MNTRKFDEMGRVTDAVFLAEQAKLAKITRRETALRQQLAMLLRDRSSLATTPRGTDDVALAAGADGRWHQWIAARQTSLNTELMQVLALKDHQTARVRQACGRSDALRQLARRAAAEEQRLSAARRDRDG